MSNTRYARYAHHYVTHSAQPRQVLMLHRVNATLAAFATTSQNSL